MSKPEWEAACTQPSPSSLVYGTENDLKKSFSDIQKMGTFERVFVESNCSVSLIGDDIAGIEGTLRWLRTIQKALPVMNLSTLEQEADTLKRPLEHRSGNLRSLWGQLWFDEILIAAWPSDAAAIAEAVRGEWADTAKLVVHQQEPSEHAIPAADVIRTVRADDAAIENDLQEWQGGLLLASSHEATRFARLGKSAQFVPIARPVYDELLADATPLYGLAGAARLLERLSIHFRKFSMTSARSRCPRCPILIFSPARIR